MIELTHEQLQALDAANGKPPVLVDQRTEEAYVLVKAKEYEKMKPQAETRVLNEIRIPEGVLQARAAIKCDLPALLASRWTRGRWVCYRRDERVAISRNYIKLRNECIRRGFEDGEFLIVMIEPGAADDDEEIDRTFVEFDDD